MYKLVPARERYSSGGEGLDQEEVSRTVDSIRQDHARNGLRFLQDRERAMAGEPVRGRCSSRGKQGIAKESRRAACR
jgi:hypothetical protein